MFVSVLGAALVMLALAPAVVVAQELRLDPTHGQPTDPFDASFIEPFSEPKFCGAQGDTVAFIWWGSDNESNALLGLGHLNSQCRAGITAVPPAGLNDEGLHQVTAFLTCDTYPNCITIAQGQATAVYTIDPPPTPSPIPTATPTPAPTKAPTPTVKPTVAPTPTPFVAPPAAPTPTPTTAPTASPTASPSPSPTASPSPVPSPTATLTAIASPPSGTPSPGPTSTPGGAPAGGPGPGGGAGVGWGPSDFVASVKDVGGISLDFAVVSTNFLLTLLLLIVFGTTSALFNNTLDANRLEIDTFFAAWRERFARIGRPIAGGLAAIVGSVGPGRRTPPLRVAAILLLTGLVYGFLSPDFGLNAQSLILFLSLALGLGIVTYVNEGGAAIFASRRLHVPAGVRVHLAALSVAVVCVLASRLIDFRPGIVYGFIASTAFLVPAALDRRDEGKVALYPALVLLGVSLVAWLLMGLVRGLETGADGWPLPFTEALLAVIFVGGLEGTFFNMVPLTFMDGKAVANWSRVVWAVIFGVATFLFWQLLINPDAGYLDALRETKVVVAVTLVVFYVVITLGTWSYFRWRARRKEPAPAEV
jgi:hypothetical protein